MLTVCDVEPTKITVVALLDHHLEWVQANRFDATYQWYNRNDGPEKTCCYNFGAGGSFVLRVWQAYPI